MSDQSETLLTVTTCLDDIAMPYMISGSTAMNFYASPRMTRDIDIVVEIREADVARLIDALTDRFYVDDEAVTDAVRRHGMFNAVHEEVMVKVDFIVRKDEPYRIVEFARRRSIRLGASTLWVVAPEDLILSKLLWSGDRRSDVQDGDVRNLLRGEPLDESYLASWAARLGVANRLLALRA